MKIDLVQVVNGICVAFIVISYSAMIAYCGKELCDMAAHLPK